MKIHLAGAVWHAGLSFYLGKGFESLGHEVKFFNESGPKNPARIKKILGRILKQPYKVDDWFRRKVGEQWLESIRQYDPDLIVIEYAVNILPEYIEKARSFKKPIIYWATSPPDGFQAKEMLLGMKYPDEIFTIDRQWMHFLEKFSYGKKIGHLPLAGSDQIFKPLIDDPELREKNAKYDLAFIGSFTPQDASASWRGSLLDSIPETYNVAVFGSGGLPYWKDRFPRLLKRAKGFSTVRAEEMNEIYNQTKIALNIHSTGHLSSISARTFEISLAGGFQIVDFREDLDVLFPKDTFANFKKREDMLPLIAEWIGKPKERWDNAAKTRAMVLEKHTWTARAKQLLESLKP
jgi:spore maturation protein CgeB